jgi:hypothetical protein
VTVLRRLHYAASISCHSVDGTHLAFGRDRNLPQLLGWLAAVNDDLALYPAADDRRPTHPLMEESR